MLLLCAKDYSGNNKSVTYIHKTAERLLKEKSDTKDIVAFLCDQERVYDKHIRIQSAKILGFKKDEEAYKGLVVALEDSDPDVRNAVVTEIITFDNKKEIEALLRKHLKTERNPGVKRIAENWLKTQAKQE